MEEVAFAGVVDFTDAFEGGPDEGVVFLWGLRVHIGLDAIVGFAIGPRHGHHRCAVGEEPAVEWLIIGGGCRVLGHADPGRSFPALERILGVGLPFDQRAAHAVGLGLSLGVGEGGVAHVVPVLGALTDGGPARCEGRCPLKGHVEDGAMLLGHVGRGQGALVHHEGEVIRNGGLEDGVGLVQPAVMSGFQRVSRIPIDDMSGIDEGCASPIDVNDASSHRGLIVSKGIFPAIQVGLFEHEVVPAFLHALGSIGISHELQAPGTCPIVEIGIVRFHVAGPGVLKGVCVGRGRLGSPGRPHFLRPQDRTGGLGHHGAVKTDEVGRFDGVERGEVSAQRMGVVLRWGQSAYRFVVVPVIVGLHVVGGPPVSGYVSFEEHGIIIRPVHVTGKTGVGLLGIECGGVTDALAEVLDPSSILKKLGEGQVVPQGAIGRHGDHFEFVAVNGHHFLPAVADVGDVSVRHELGEPGVPVIEQAFLFAACREGRSPCFSIDFTGDILIEGLPFGALPLHADPVAVTLRFGLTEEGRAVAHFACDEGDFVVACGGNQGVMAVLSGPGREVEFVQGHDIGPTESAFFSASLKAEGVEVPGVQREPGLACVGAESGEFDESGAVFGVSVDGVRHHGRPFGIRAVQRLWEAVLL